MDIYADFKSAPIKFIIEADGNQEPVLVFIQGEFQIAIDRDQRQNIERIQLRLGGPTAYEIHFDNAAEGERLADALSDYSANGISRIQ